MSGGGSKHRLGFGQSLVTSPRRPIAAGELVTVTSDGHCPPGRRTAPAPPPRSPQRHVFANAGLFPKLHPTISKVRVAALQKGETVINEAFDAECDRLSRLVDPEGAEQAEWQSTYGKQLDAVVDMAHKTFEKREDLALLEATIEPKKRSFRLIYARGKIIEVVTVWFGIAGNAPVIWAEPIPGTLYEIDMPRHYRNDSEKPIEEWVPAVMTDIMSKVRRG